MADPTRDFPDEEIEQCLTSYGGWRGWIGEFPDTATRAIVWKAHQGDDLPEGAFMYVGNLDDAKAKAAKMAAEV